MPCEVELANWSTRCKVWFTNFTPLGHSRVRLLNVPLTWLFKLTLISLFAMLQQAGGPVAAYRLSLNKLSSAEHQPFLFIRNLEANMPGCLTNLKHFQMRWNRHCELESALRKPAAWPGPGTGRASKATLIQLGVSNCYPEWPKSGICFSSEDNWKYFLLIGVLNLWVFKLVWSVLSFRLCFLCFCWYLITLVSCGFNSTFFCCTSDANLSKACCLVGNFSFSKKLIFMRKYFVIHDKFWGLCFCVLKFIICRYHHAQIWNQFYQSQENQG